MNIHAKTIGVQAFRFLDAVEAVERVQRRLGVQNHLALGIDTVASGIEQQIDIFLFDPVAAEFGFDRRQHALQAASGKTDPDIVDIGPGNPLGLLDRVADIHFGCLGVGDIAPFHALAGALAGAENGQFAIVHAPGNHRRDFRRADIQCGEDFFNPCCHLSSPQLQSLSCQCNPQYR